MRRFVAVIGLLLTSNAIAIDYIKKNHFNVGTNIFYRDYSEVLVLPAKSDENGMLFGFLLGYEHKAPNAIMFAVDLELALGKTHYDGALQNIFGEYVAPWQSTTENVFLNIDTEIGYTFVKREKHLFTPFLGIGASGWIRDLDNTREIYVWDYLSFGLQYDYNASSKWQYGLHVKVMPMVVGTMDAPDDSDYEMTLGNKTHFEVSVPIIYKDNPNDTNYCRFTPYYQYQRFGKSDGVPVYNLPWGFYIYEPASRTHIVGVKIEYSFGF